jgi:rhamnosyltransferase
VSGARVSIVLPVRNGATTLPALLDSLARQRVSYATETIAVDSASTDGTRDLLRGRVDHLITISREAFNHGLTRNLGIERAAGELVVLIVQDALPASDTWLEKLTGPLWADPRIAGAFARQTPRPEASAITRYYLDRWLASGSSGRIAAVASARAFDALDPGARFDRCAFDNVCSCLRRSVWLRHPFRQTEIAEDLEWAKEVLLEGHLIQYIPDAAVIHSHDRPAGYEFLRTYLLHRRLYDLFGLRTVPTLPSLGRSICSSIAAHRRCLKEGTPSGGRARALALAVAWPLGQYLGGLSAASGWPAVRSKIV